MPNFQLTGRLKTIQIIQFKTFIQEHIDLVFKLPTGASISRFVGLSVGPWNKILTALNHLFVQIGDLTSEAKLSEKFDRLKK